MMSIAGLIMMTFLAASLQQQRHVFAQDCIDEQWCQFVTERLCTTSPLIGANCKAMCGTCGNQISCPDIEPIEYADIRTSSRSPLKVGTIANFICDPGFQRVGTDRIICLRSGIWSDPVPYCAVRSCQRVLNKLENGRKCRKRCKRDADCKGSLKTCQCDDWCGKSCFNRNAECPSLSNPRNGYVVENGWKYGQVVSYACNKGFSLSGPSTRRCRSDRKWSGVSPLCISFSACGQTGEDKNDIYDGKITRGVNAKEGAWPWQILLIHSGRYSVKQIHNPQSGFAGGSVINDEWILSAAHVFTDTFQRNLNQNVWKNTFLIVSGMTKYPKPELEIPEYIRIFDPQTVFVHPSFDRKSFDYDVALIQIGNTLKRGPNDVFVIDKSNTNRKFSFSRFVRPVCLPCMKGDPLKPVDLLKNFDKKLCNATGKSALPSFVSSGSSVIVTGFGAKSLVTGEMPTNLQEGLLTLFDNSKCAKSVQDIKRLNTNVRFTNRMFCAVGGNETSKIDSCSGDSGGPVVWKFSGNRHSYWMQIGIVSWGVKCAGKYPGFYTAVPSVMDWVWETLEKSRKKKRLLCQRKIFKDSNHFNASLCPPAKAVGAKCSVTCVNGYGLKSKMKVWTTSCKLKSPNALKAEWDFSNPPTCEVDGCDDRKLDGFANGRVECTDYSDIKPIGTTCSITCFERYRLIGNNIITCQKDGNLTRIPTCEMITCSEIDAFEHGSTVCTDGNKVDSECTFLCHGGRQKLGPDKTICRQNGKWSKRGSVKCVQRACDRPAEIQFGKMTCSNSALRVGTSCKIACLENRVLFLEGNYTDGNEHTIRCLPNQQWSVAPSCACPKCKTGDNCELTTSWELARDKLKRDGGNSRLNYAGHKILTELSTGFQRWQFVWRCLCRDKRTGHSVRCTLKSARGSCEHACSQVIKDMVSNGDYKQPCDSELMDGVGC